MLEGCGWKGKKIQIGSKVSKKKKNTPFLAWIVPNIGRKWIFFCFSEFGVFQVDLKTNRTLIVSQLDVDVANHILISFESIVISAFPYQLLKI